MLRLIHEHVVAGEEIEQVAVRREKNLRELALLAFGPGNRVGDGVPLQVVAQQRWLSDDESIRLLRVCLDEQDGEALLGVDVQSPNTNLRIAGRERELAEGLFAGDVDRLARLALRKCLRLSESSIPIGMPTETGIESRTRKLASSTTRIFLPYVPT